MSCGKSCISVQKVCTSELQKRTQSTLTKYYLKRHKKYSELLAIQQEEVSRLSERLSVMNDEFMDLYMDSPKETRGEVKKEWRKANEALERKINKENEVTQKMWDKLNEIEKMKSVVYGGHKSIKEMEKAEKAEEESRIRKKYQKQIDKGLADPDNGSPFTTRNKFIPPDMMKEALYDQGFTKSKKDADDLIDSAVEYKGARFKKINTDLIEGRKNSTADKIDKTLFDNDKIPVYQGKTLYRGLRGIPPASVGDEIEWKGYSSFSPLLDTAKGFQGGDGIIMRLKDGTKDGKEITGAGPGYLFESEVLLPRNSKFKVVGITEEEGVTIHDVEQV